MRNMHGDRLLSNKMHVKTVFMLFPIANLEEKILKPQTTSRDLHCHLRIDVLAEDVKILKSTP
jgi:hypothetical protein